MNGLELHVHMVVSHRILYRIAYCARNTLCASIQGQKENLGKVRLWEPQRIAQSPRKWPPTSKARGIFHGKRLSTPHHNNVPVDEAGSAAYRRLMNKR